MRTQTFLENLGTRYNANEAQRLASLPGIHGGWEVWLQIEIAKTFMDIDSTVSFYREQPYSNSLNANAPWISYNKQTKIATYTANRNSASKCDFFMVHSGGRDQTYLELKCINPNNNNPLNDAWTRYNQDIDKIIGINTLDPNINGIALLATYGTFPSIPNFPPNMNVYVWDPYEGTGRGGVSSLANVKLNGNPRFFIVGCSVQ